MAEIKESKTMSEGCSINYPGPERRKRAGDRRSDECMWHEAHEQRFSTDERDIYETKTCVGKMKEEMKTKVPMKLFYTIVTLIVAIFAVQWGTYERVNTMALTHAEVMGSLNTNLVEVKGEIAQVKTEITHANNINVGARTSIKEALVSQQKTTDEKLKNIQATIDRLTK